MSPTFYELLFISKLYAQFFVLEVWPITSSSARKLVENMFLKCWWNLIFVGLKVKTRQQLTWMSIIDTQPLIKSQNYYFVFIYALKTFSMARHGHVDKS